MTESVAAAQVYCSRSISAGRLATTSDRLFKTVGIEPANFTALSIWNMALSNRIEPRSLLPERGSSRLFCAAAAASNGWVHNC